MTKQLDKVRLATIATSCALVCASALALAPKGFMVFGGLLLAVTLLVPGVLATAWPHASPVLRWLLLLAVLVVGTTSGLVYWSGDGIRGIDKAALFLVMPWCALFVYALPRSRTWLWSGSLYGVLLAFALSLGDAVSGVERAGAGSNPIVFANAVLALLVLAVYCRPANASPRSLMAIAMVLAMGVTAIVLSGSRGTLPGFGLMLLVALIGNGRKKMWPRLGLSTTLLVGAFAVMWTVPWLAAQTRLHDIQADLEKYAQGHVDSPIGARLQFLVLSKDAFTAHPWTGIGLDRFGTLVDQLPLCRMSEHSLHQPGVCQLGHAHNDLAQWAATMGIPGLIMIFAIYLVPLLLFVRLIRAQRPGAPVGAAWTGAMLVSVYMLSGLTQSMFAHALTTTIYVVFVGLLMGLAMRESSTGLQQSVASSRVPSTLGS